MINRVKHMRDELRNANSKLSKTDLTSGMHNAMGNCSGIKLVLFKKRLLKSCCVYLISL